MSNKRYSNYDNYDNNKYNKDKNYGNDKRRSGKEYYNSEHAFRTTIFTNFLLYGVPAYFVIKGLKIDSITPDSNSCFTPEFQQQLNVDVHKAIYSIGCLAYTLCESGLRSALAAENNRESLLGNQTTCASLPGKIISLPLDAMIYAYDAGRNYLESVKRRVTCGEKGETINLKPKG